MTARESTIAVAGAGSVGCYVGGCLALAGRRVTLLGRPGPMETITRQGLRIGDRDGRDATVPPGALAGSADPALLSCADIVLVTVKSGATAEMAALVAAHARPDAIVVSLQNGIGNVEALRTALGPSRGVVAGMVPFNIVQSDDPDGVPRFHRATSGRLHVEAGRPDLVAALDVPGLPVVAHPDMQAVAWAKLVMNLNNALNALSGLPLREQLADRRWRSILAAQISEALDILRLAGLGTTRIDGVDPRLAPFALRLPDLLFRIAARSMLAIDARARSSMQDDLERGRQTEIDHLQGAIVAMAESMGASAPVSSRIRELIRAAELAGTGSPRLAPDEVA